MTVENGVKLPKTTEPPLLTVKLTEKLLNVSPSTEHEKFAAS